MVKKLIYIEWQDAFANTAWMTKAEVDKWKEGEMMINQVGWLLEETSKQIILAARFNPADNGDVEQFGSLQKIPKTWIRKRINLTKYVK